MDESDEIIEKVDSYLEKKELDVEGKYFLCKQLCELYWDEIKGEEEADEEEETEEDVIEDEPPEPEEDEVDELEQATEPETPPKKKVKADLPPPPESIPELNESHEEGIEADLASPVKRKGLLLKRPKIKPK